MPKKIRVKHILFRMKNKIVKKELERQDDRVKLCIAKPIKASEETVAFLREDYAKETAGVLAW